MEAPKLPSLFGFKSKRPNQFYIEPRYYDERKEKMKKRYQRINKEVNGQNDSKNLNREEFRSSLREHWGSGYARNKMGNNFSKRVLFYLLILLALAYYLLF